MKFLRQILFNKWFYLGLVPMLLFLSGAAFAGYQTITLDSHFTVMPVVQSENASIELSNEQLLDENSIKGEFTATYNNLGSVALKVKNKHKETVSDNFKVLFRIKEKGAKKWYSSNTYYGGQFRELDLFPFGFNLVADSKGKTYTFELFSKGANESNALTIDKNQNIVGMYQLNKSDLKNPVIALGYLYGKVNYLFHNIGATFSAIMYFLPLLVYLYMLADSERAKVPAWLPKVFLVKLTRRRIGKPTAAVINKYLGILHKSTILDEYKLVKEVPTVMLFLFVAICIDIFIIDKTQNILLLIVVLLWGISIVMYNIRLQSSFLLAFTFLSVCFILLLFNQDSFAEKSAIWAYLFLSIGAIHSLFAIRLVKRT